MKIAIKTIILSVFFTVAATVSAQVSTLYYMKTISTRHELNPAFQPSSNIYVQVPVLSGFYITEGNNSLSLNDMFYTTNGQLVNFLHPEYGNKDKFYKLLDNNVRFFAEFQCDLLGVGVRKEDSYITLGISQKINASMAVPKDFFKLMLYGTPDTTKVNSYDLKNFGINANAYTEIAFGYSRNVDEQLTLGGKVKLLLGQANVSVESSNLTLETSREKWIARMNTEINMTLPTIDDYELDKNNEQIDEIIYKDNAGFGDYIKPAGIGGALDLGASYYMLEDNRLHLSASVIDLGFIRWGSSKTAKMMIDGNFEFEGVELDVDENGEVSLGDFSETIDKFIDSISYKTNIGDGYTRWIPAKIFLGAEYSFFENRLTVGLLSKTTIVNKRLHEEITTSVNYLPVECFNASLSYSWVNGRRHFGLGLGGRLGIVNMYIAADYVPLNYSADFYPTHTKVFNLKGGIVLNFGNKEKEG